MSSEFWQVSTKDASSTSQQEISWINGKPIPHGEMSDGAMTGIMIGFALFVAFVCCVCSSDR